MASSTWRWRRGQTLLRSLYPRSAKKKAEIRRWRPPSASPVNDNGESALSAKIAPVDSFIAQMNSPDLIGLRHRICCLLRASIIFLPALFLTVGTAQQPAVSERPDAKKTKVDSA